MPWRECDAMSLRAEFVVLADMDGSNVRELCRRFGISPRTGYKWVGRWHDAGRAGLADRSRRPRNSPTRTPKQMEQLVLGVRAKHPAWGGRKLRWMLLGQGYDRVPSASTITAILRRHGCLDREHPSSQGPWRRFTAPYPNALWQMDFKGSVRLTSGGWCQPLSLLDDCARFCLTLDACADQRTATVRSALTGVFRRYGMPDWILVDNGSPWGSYAEHRYTPLRVWLIEQGVAMTHSRPYHPQTHGKVERFHRTLEAELIGRHAFADLPECRRLFERWRATYNLDRPHEALGMEPPATRYRPSQQAYCESVGEPAYLPGDIVRVVYRKGRISLHGRDVHATSKAFRGKRIALRPTDSDGVYDVYYYHHRIAQIDLRDAVAT